MEKGTKIAIGPRVGVVSTPNVLLNGDRKLEDAIALAVKEGREAAKKLQLTFDKVHEQLAEAVQLVEPFKEHVRKGDEAIGGLAALFVAEVKKRSGEMQ